MIESLVSSIFGTEWRILLIVGTLLLLSAELGFHVGRSHAPESRQRRQGQSGTLQGALLGLLGLLLGFTFAMSVSRFDTRKTLVLDEANAIGTVWLRAGFLPDAARDVVRPALADYIDARLAAASVSPDSETFRRELARSEMNQGLLWRTTVAQSREAATPMTALFAASLNDLIDLDAKRQAAIANHVPASVWLLLLLVSVTVCWATGYTTALGESGRLALSMIILPLLLTVVIAIIADLDNPRRGLIQVSQKSMTDLQHTLKKYH